MTKTATIYQYQININSINYF